jgi:hypothetical protein
MNNPVKSSPLTLLLNGDVSETLAKLRSFLVTGNGFSLCQPCSDSGSVFEVIYCGVTLRLAIIPNVSNLAGLKQIFCNLEATSIGCAMEVGLGDHVSGGERVPAIIQALLGAGQKLGVAFGALGAIWHPASIVSGFDYFSEVVADYLAGGAFPVLAMINFKAGDDGIINSTGLSLLAGQELRISAAGMNQNEIMRRVVRVAHDIAVNGPILAPAKLTGIEVHEVLKFHPEPETGLVRLTICSGLDA